MGQHWQELVPQDRFVVKANGLLSEYDRKVLTFLYQPLVGYDSFSLYMTFWAALDDHKLRSQPVTHHFLMDLSAMHLDDIFEARIKLEGIGLLNTYVKETGDSRSFIYELNPPLTPEQFFNDGMLNIYLYKKIGNSQWLWLKRFFSIEQIAPEPDYVNVSRSLQEVFDSGINQRGVTKPDQGSEFVGRSEPKKVQIDESIFDFDLLMNILNESLFPKKLMNAKVREAISNLAFLYNIDPFQMKKFLMDAYNPSIDQVNIEELRKSARDWYLFVNYDEYPDLYQRIQPPRYRIQLDEPKSQEEKLIRSLETTSPLKVFKDASGGIEPSDTELSIIEDALIKKELLPGVVNVLIQYVLLRTDSKFTKSYVEQIAGHWARKGIKTVKEAMDLARDEHSKYLSWIQEKKTGKTSNKKAIRTELLPDWFDKETKAQPESIPNNADVEASKREIEEMLKALDD